MSTGATGSVALPAIYQTGRDESVRVILGKAAEQVEIAADAFNLHGFIKPKAYSERFTKARDAIDEGSRLIGVVQSAGADGALRDGLAGAQASLKPWRAAAVDLIDQAATWESPHGRGTPASDREKIRAIAAQLRDIAPAAEAATPETVLFDEATRLSEPAAPAVTSGRRGAGLLGVVKLGGAGAGGAGLLELAQAAMRFL